MAIHAGVLHLSFVAPDLRVGHPRAQGVPGSSAIRVVQAVVVDHSIERTAPPPTSIVPPSQIEALTVGHSTEVAEALPPDRAVDSTTILERLWAGSTNPLWRPVASQRSKDAAHLIRVPGSLAENIHEFNDSVAGSRVEWTVGAGGGRWGVSTGQLRFGPLALDLCEGGSTRTACGIAGREGDDAERLRRYLDIEDQAARGQLLRFWQSRARLIRARMNAKRDSSRRR